MLSKILAPADILPSEFVTVISKIIPFQGCTFYTMQPFHALLRNERNDINEIKTCE